jgi:hypothetical protein
LERPDPSQFGFQLARVADFVEVRELGFDASEQAIDPGMVVRRAAGRAEVPGDAGAGHERGSGLRGHLRAGG